MSSRLNWKNSNLLSTLKQWLRVLQSLRYSEPSTSTPLSCGDPSQTKPADDLASTKYASLRELPLKVFIENYCYGAQLPNWEKLLSEYYIVRQDKQASEFVRLVYGMEQIRYRAMSIDLLVATLREGYHKDVAEALRAYFPRFKFTEDSYIQEIEYAVNIEKNNKAVFDTYRQQLDLIQDKKKGDKTPQDKYDGFRATMLQINKHAGYEAVKDDSNTYDFAVAYRELDKYIEELNKKKK